MESSGTTITRVQQSISDAIRGKTLCSVFADTTRAWPDVPALKWKDRDGWHALTWHEYREQVRDVALGLRSLGFAPGEFGLILARNRPEHLIADLGILHARGIPVSVYTTLAGDQIAYIANHCEATVAFVEDGVFLKRLEAVRSKLHYLKHVVVIEPGVGCDAPGVTSLEGLRGLGAESTKRVPSAFDVAWQSVKPDDLATLIYTSGTTGHPKGVMDTHGAVLWMAESYQRLEPVDPGRRSISYLPLAHAAERTSSHWNGIAFASITHFCPDPTEILSFLVEVRPMHFVGVPRVWEKLHAGIRAGLAAERDEQKRSLVHDALAAGRELVAVEQRSEAPSESLRTRVAEYAPIYKAILTKIGLDQCTSAVCGAAPVAPAVLEFFHALGLPITEAWGMTEIGAVGTKNPCNRVRIGTVGPAMPGAEIRVADDGELLYRGGNIMKGYYKEPDQTRVVIDEEGFLHTGDIATIDADGYARIVDRKKELIITSGGKNVSPANLENLLKEHPLIGQAAAIGDQRPYITALVVLDPDVAPAWARASGIAFESTKDLAGRAEVRAELQRAVGATNERLARVEQIKRFVVLPEPWSPEGGQLTPTMKLKRRLIHAMYADIIEGMYAAAPIGWMPDATQSTCVR